MVGRIGGILVNHEELSTLAVQQATESASLGVNFKHDHRFYRRCCFLLRTHHEFRLFVGGYGQEVALRFAESWTSLWEELVFLRTLQST